MATSLVGLSLVAIVSLLRMTSVPARYQTAAVLFVAALMVANELWTGESASDILIARRETAPVSYWMNVTIKVGVSIILLFLLMMDLRGPS